MARAKWNIPPGTTAAHQRCILGSWRWRDLTPDYGHWVSTYNRFRNWQKDGTWEKLLTTLANDPDLEWLMIDGNYIKAHQHGTGSAGGNQAAGLT